MITCNDEKVLAYTSNTKKNNIDWNNSENNTFYERVNADGLKKLAEQAGLASCCDIELIKPYWSHAQSILEVGAGYGRVIDYLLNQGYSGKITAIERCQVLFNHLTPLYADKVNLINDDLLTHNFKNEKFDLILWLWSGMADFSPLEQKTLVKSLTQHLAKNGKIIVDTLSNTILPLNVFQNSIQTTYLLTFEGAIIHVYSPSFKEIQQYAKYAKLEKVEHISYSTPNKRDRIIHILN
jgi:phospholipid N-methyltransferase